MASRLKIKVKNVYRGKGALLPNGMVREIFLQPGEYDATDPCLQGKSYYLVENGFADGNLDALSKLESVVVHEDPYAEINRLRAELEELRGSKHNQAPKKD